MIVFAIATGFALQLPRAVVATQPVDEAEKQELRSAGIPLAASAMGLIRAIVGFVAFMLAFDFKNSGAPLWQLGIRGRPPPSSGSSWGRCSRRGCVGWRPRNASSSARSW